MEYHGSIKTGVTTTNSTGYTRGYAEIYSSVTNIQQMWLPGSPLQSTPYKTNHWRCSLQCTRFTAENVLPAGGFHLLRHSVGHHKS